MDKDICNVGDDGSVVVPVLTLRWRHITVEFSRRRVAYKGSGDLKTKSDE